jgi:hypothetical protein
MTNPRGTREESRAVLWLRANGWPYARRIRQTGARDEGDISLGDGIGVAVESKAERRIDLSGYMRELGVEMDNKQVELGFVIVKKRGTTDAGEYYAVLPLRVLNKLLLRALRPRRIIPPRRT